MYVCRGGAQACFYVFLRVSNKVRQRALYSLPEHPIYGEVAERLNALVLKTSMG